MDAKKIRKEFGYEEKPKQWQIGFDALLRHMPDYQKEANKDSPVHGGVSLPFGRLQAICSSRCKSMAVPKLNLEMDLCFHGEDYDRKYIVCNENNCLLIKAAN